MSKFEKSVDFVARHYRKGMFRPTQKFVRPWSWRKISVAASIAIGVLVASAALYMHLGQKAPEQVPVEVEQPLPAPPMDPSHAEEIKVVKITFDDAPLSEVVAEIEKVYDVRVKNLGDKGDLRISLSYEGTARGLIDIINDTFATNLTIEENK